MKALGRIARTGVKTAVVALVIAAAPLVSQLPAVALNNSSISMNGGAYLIGHEFEHINQQGAVLSVYGAACSTPFTDVDNQYGNLDNGSGWNDVISSFNNTLNPSYCWERHFNSAGYGGSADPDYRSSSSTMVEGMNDVTSSIKWT